jgi:hypothetical protein
MNAILTKATATLTPSTYCVELRIRLERLEILRTLAALRCDLKGVRLIDKQIKFVVTEWLDAFVFGFEESYRAPA